jgi:hypothetical protein
VLFSAASHKAFTVARSAPNVRLDSIIYPDIPLPLTAVLSRPTALSSRSNPGSRLKPPIRYVAIIPPDYRRRA